MKKKLLPIFYRGIAVFSLLLLVLGLSQQEAIAQCTNSSSYGSATAPTSGTTTISTCSYQEEYSTLNSVAAGTVYSCAIASGGYVTIHQGTPAGPVIGYGPSPLSWTSTVSGTYYAHWSVNAACATTTGCVTTSITFIATLPATPPTPTQDPSAPTCTGGSALTVSGTPGTDEVWYWQTTASGTSTANPYSGPYTVFANGTYYLRTYNTANTYWSANSSSVTVSNFPTATTPPAPTAGQNPACNSTTLTAATPPSGTTYYWQTIANGSSNASDASTPLTVTATGSYYLAAYDNTTQCWSSTSSTAITIQTVIPPAALASPTYYNYCSNALTMPVSAQVPAPTTNTATCSATATASGDDGSSVTATVTNFSCAPTTIVSASMNASIGQYCALYGWYSYNVIVNGTTILTGLCDQNNIDLTPYLPLTSVSIVSNDDDGYPFDFVNMSLTVNVSYITDPYTISWFSAPTGGSAIGTGTSLEALGSSVLPTAVNGSYQFYAANNQGSCASATRTLVTLNVTDVLANLNPVNILCNGMNNGSFTLGTVTCGSAPFTYSVDGGAFGPIPNNLTPGVHSIVMKDLNNLNSAPISVTITEPSAPTGLNAYNVTFFNGMLTWTPQGNETTWNVEYGPAGFTPGTGFTMSGVTNDTVQVTGLTEDTDYEFYVQAGCTASSAWAGPFSFSTDVPFSTWDSQCGPGFTPIHTSGTALNLSDDASIGITTVNPVSFQGVTSNNITVSNNGWIQFGAVTLNAWSVDLDDEYGNVYWQETTLGGDNYLIVEWYSRPKYSTVTGQDVTFEIAINQTTGEIFYLYDDKVFGGSQSAYDYAGNFATISAAGPMSNISISYNSQTYLQNNSCVRFYTALCPNVQNMVTITYTDDATLNWDAGPYGETNWTVIYGLDGFDPTVPGQAIDTFTVTSSQVDFGAQLTQLTCYDAYIYSECQADNLTSDGFLVNFCTKPNCSDITGLAGTTDPDSLELTWNWIPSSVVYPVTGFNVQYGMTGFNLGSGTIVPATGIDFSDTIPDANLMGSGVYQIYVQAVCNVMTGDTSNWVGPISVVMPLTNDIVCSQEALQLNTTYTFNNNGAAVSLNETNIAPPATGAQTTDGWVNSTLNGTLWYTFVAPPSGSVRVNSTAISYNGQAAVYSAVNCADFNTFTLRAANDDEIGGTSLAPNFTVCGLTPGNTYYIMYDKFNGTSGNFSLKVTEIVLEGGNALPLTNICYGTNIDLFTTITGNNTGGTWSSAIPSVNASITGSDFESDGLAYTTFDFEYRVVDGCAYDSIISQVKVFAPSNAGEDGTILACRNEPIDLLAGLNGNADLNGDWYDPSDVLLPNSQVTTANFPGQYNYDYISGNGVCPDDTANVVVTVNPNNCNFLSVEENALEEIALYPNPSTGVVFIESTFTGNFDLTVTDINGRTIQTGTNVTSGTNTVNLKEVERGTYFFKLSTENAEKVFRVVIQ